jgi:hypothetical protein
MTLLPRKVCRSDAYSLTAIMLFCNPSTAFEFLESCFNSLSVFDLIFSSVHPILVEYSVLVYLNVSLF